MPERALIELLYGKSAHANPVACVEDLSPEFVGRHVDSFPHSIWQLLGHMNFWMDYELRRIRGEAPPYPVHAADSWPANSSPRGEHEWKKGVSQFRDLLAQLAALAESRPEELPRPIEATTPSHTKHASALVDVL